jgi:peptidoglycan/LPS O-acetylase OafA/YrhL
MPQLIVFQKPRNASFSVYLRSRSCLGHGANSPAVKVQERYLGLESLRGIAALLVVWFHVWALNMLPLPKWLTPLVSNLGLGVQMFFILSAFCLCIGYHNRLETAADIRRFAVRRFFRIAPLFYALMLAWIGIGYFQSGAVPPLHEVILNASFLFNLPPAKGVTIVWASWTIGIEIMAYALFPFAILAMTNWQRTAAALLVTTLVAFAFQMALDGLNLPSGYAWFGLTAQAPFFVLGVLSWQALLALKDHPKREVIGNVLLAGAALYWIVLAGLGLSSLKMAGVPVGKYLIGTGFSPVILSQVLAPARWITNPLTVYLGVRGYSLYLLHPILVLLTIPVIQTAKQTSSIGAFAVGCALVSSITIVGAHLTYRWIEVPGQALGRRLISRPVGASKTVPAE